MKVRVLNKVILRQNTWSMCERSNRSITGYKSKVIIIYQIFSYDVISNTLQP